MAKRKGHHLRGPIRNRYETKYRKKYREHNNAGDLLRTSNHHRKNVRRHHRRH